MIIAAKMKYLRKIAGRTRRDRYSNEYIREELEQKPITVILKKNN